MISAIKGFGERVREPLRRTPPDLDRSSGEYDSTGIYLDYLSRPLIASGKPRIRLDETGLPIVKYAHGWSHNPTTTAQWGLQEFSFWMTRGAPAHLANAVRAGDWLTRTQAADAGLWSYEFDFPVGGLGLTLAAPWSSAMAQGQAISLLSRLGPVTGDPSYLSAARKACEPLEREVARGGLCADFFGRPFFEEYPTDPPSFTLNGFMFTLIGLYDLAMRGEERARHLLDNGLMTLAYCLPFFDTGSVSAYHLGHISNPPRLIHTSLVYHQVHVTLLRALCSVRPHEVLSFYAERWNDEVVNS